MQIQKKFTIALFVSLLLTQIINAEQTFECCCPKRIEIKSIPLTGYIISKSNTTYCVKKELAFAGASGQPAITVNPGVHDIIINFNGFDLTLQNSQEIGVQLLGDTTNKVSNIVIKNGTIRSATAAADPNCIAINLTDTNAASGYINRVLIENMQFVDINFGILLNPQIASGFDLMVSKCQFSQVPANPASVFNPSGIALGTIQGLVVEDCMFLEDSIVGGLGMQIFNNATDISVRRCNFNGGLIGLEVLSFDDPVNGFQFAFRSENVLIDQCQFNNIALQDIDLDGGASNVQVTNSNFYSDIDLQISRESIGFCSEGVQAPGNSLIVSGLLVDHCTFFTGTNNGGDRTGPRTIRIGIASVNLPTHPNFVTRDVIIRNSTFTHLNAPNNYNDVLAVFVDGVLIENCVFDSGPSGRNADCSPIFNVRSGLEEKAANIHFGYLGEGFAKNVTIRGNQIGGGAQVGILLESATDMIINSPSFGPYQTIFGPNENIVIENNNITAAEQGILFENTSSSLIKGNYISGVNGSSSNGTKCAPGVGIQLSGPITNFPTAASSCNTILGNTVVNNGTGILVQSGAHGNLIKRNRVFNNSSKQIVIKDKAKNVSENNTTFSIGTPCSSAPTKI